MTTLKGLLQAQADELNDSIRERQSWDQLAGDIQALRGGLAILGILATGGYAAELLAGVVGAGGMEAASDPAVQQEIEEAIEGATPAVDNAVANATSGNPGPCFVAGTPVLLGDGETEANIEQIQVGQRVATDGGVANSVDGKTKTARSNSTRVRRKTWRLVNLEVDAMNADGTIDVVQVQDLMPLSTLRSESAKPGTHIPVPLDLKAFGEVGETALVRSIEPCPEIAAGPGRVVLATIEHSSDFGFQLTLADSEGKNETIGVTGFHKLYTEDHGWTSVSTLNLGESIRGDHGTLKVISLVRDPGVHQVFNLSVESDHVYFVGNLTALAHNDCTDIAQSLQNQFGGNIYRLNAGPGSIIPAAAGNPGQAYHDVLFDSISQTVRDPMYNGGSSNPIPLDQWMSIFPYSNQPGAYHFGPIFQ